MNRFLLYQILVIVRFTNVSMKYRKVKIDDPTLRGSQANDDNKLTAITLYIRAFTICSDTYEVSVNRINTCVYAKTFSNTFYFPYFFLKLVTPRVQPPISITKHVRYTQLCFVPLLADFVPGCFFVL